MQLFKELFNAAGELRKNIDLAEYKYVVLGLIFLKCVSDHFEALHNKLQESKGEHTPADPENLDEYKAANVFWVPPIARWSYLCERAALASIGQDLDKAMAAMEKENRVLKGVLPKVYVHPSLDKATLKGLIDLIGKIELGQTAEQPKDIFGEAYEYFLAQFALAEGKPGGRFYTPRAIVELLVKMVEPSRGKVFDPCCCSGGMLVTSGTFVKEHQGQLSDISIYGQESDELVYQLCQMNLAVHRIHGSHVVWNSEGSFLKDAHTHLRAEFILAKPPFSDSDWDRGLPQDDKRWKYGEPPPSNANFAWVQHFLHHLSPKGVAGFVLTRIAMTTRSSNEGVIRKNIIDAGIVDCIVNLPTKLFVHTQIPACVWIISNKRDGYDGERKRDNEILFIDAYKLGYLVGRRKRKFSDDDVHKIAQTYLEWKKEGGTYKDVPGFCASVNAERVKALGYSLSPGPYVGLEEAEEDFDFETRFAELKTEFAGQVEEEAELSRRIQDNLGNLETEK